MNITDVKIYHLSDRPEHINTVSDWIYHEFVDKEKMSLEQIIEKLYSRFINKLPITIIALNAKEECLGTVSLFENDLKTRKDF